MKIKKIASTILVFLIFQGIFAESFRVRKVIPVEVQENATYEYTVFSGINDAIAFFLPEQKKYLEGIELKITIPQAVAQWRDSVAFCVYDSITPKPSASQIDYSGTKIFVTPIPTKLSWNVQIPLTETNSIKEGSYNSLKINVLPDLKNNFAFVRFQPAMKGIPEETFLSEFKICVKPILVNKGNLSVKISTYDNIQNPYEIFIDGTSYSMDKKDFFLEAGVHTLNIQSEFYRSETRSVYIEQAKDTTVEINLQSIEPTLKISAPQNTLIFIDEKKFSPKEPESQIIVTEGEHFLKFLIGDYEIMRTINAEKGKSYNINLKIDLQILEE